MTPEHQGKVSSRIRQADAASCSAALDSLRLAAGAVAGPLGPPELVIEIKYLTWAEDGLLLQVVYQGLREDKPTGEVVRPPAATETVAAGRKF